MAHAPLLQQRGLQRRAKRKQQVLDQARAAQASARRQQVTRLERLRQITRHG
jgi:hypothetical protein